MVPDALDEERVALLLSETASRFELDPERRARVRVRVLATVTAAPSAEALTRFAAARRARQATRARTLRWPRLVAIITAASMVSGPAVAWASGDALPGGPLYLVKRLGERVVVAVQTNAEARARLRVLQAERRADELDRLSVKDPAAAAAFAPEVVAEAYKAAEACKDLPGSRSAAVITRLAAITERQRARLEALRDRLPLTAQQGIDQALANAGGDARMQAADVHRARTRTARARAAFLVARLRSRRAAGSGSTGDPGEATLAPTSTPRATSTRRSASPATARRTPARGQARVKSRTSKVRPQKMGTRRSDQRAAPQEAPGRSRKTDGPARADDRLSA